VTINEQVKLYWNLISYPLRKLTQKQCLTDVVWRAIKFFVQRRTKRTTPADPQLPKRPCLQILRFQIPIQYLSIGTMHPLGPKKDGKDIIVHPGDDPSSPLSKNSAELGLHSS
jgi:hypothetical protein